MLIPYVVHACYLLGCETMNAFGNLVCWPLTSAGSRTALAASPQRWCTRAPSALGSRVLVGFGPSVLGVLLPQHWATHWTSWSLALDGPSTLGALLPRHWPTHSTSWILVYGGCLKLVGSPCATFALPLDFCSCSQCVPKQSV